MARKDGKPGRASQVRQVYSLTKQADPHIGLILLGTFVAGTLVLALATGVSIALRGAPSALPAEPWLYVGGFLGAAYILLGALIVAQTGVLLMGLGSVLGQLVTSVVIDLLWPAAAGPALWQVIAMVLVAVASVLVALPWRRRR